MSRHTQSNQTVLPLVMAVKAGDQAAMVELLQKFLPFRKSLAAFWGKRLPKGPEADWDDLKQQVDLAFIEAIHGYDPGLSREAVLHLFLATKWAVVKWYKRVLHPLGNLEVEYIGAYEDELAAAPDDSDDAPDIADPRWDVQDQLGLLEELRTIALTPRQVQVLAAVASSESISEAARRLGMPRGAVTTHLLRTREKIKSARGA